MTTWQVEFDYSRSLGILSESEISTLNAMEDHLGEAAIGQDAHGALSAILTLEAGSHDKALHDADVRMADAIREFQLDPGDIVEARALTEERAEDEVNTPNYPDIVSAVEAADILGVSRQRLHQLYREHPDFPDPLYELRTGPLWVRAGIEAFNERWTRKPGRPRRDLAEH